MPLLTFAPPFQVQIQSKKIDLSHVTSKCGSLDNIHHRPGNRKQTWHWLGASSRQTLLEVTVTQVQEFSYTQYYNINLAS